jgi:hypothetical protein
VCHEGIDYRVCSRGGVEKGLGVAVFLRGTFRVRVIVDRARGVFVDLGVTGRTRSTNRMDHVLVDCAHGVIVDRGRGERRRFVCCVEGSERVLRGGYGRGCHCGAR